LIKLINQIEEEQNQDTDSENLNSNSNMAVERFSDDPVQKEFQEEVNEFPQPGRSRSFSKDRIETDKDSQKLELTHSQEVFLKENLPLKFLSCSLKDYFTIQLFKSLSYANLLI